MTKVAEEDDMGGNFFFFFTSRITSGLRASRGGVVGVWHLQLEWERGGGKRAYGKAGASIGEHVQRWVRGRWARAANTSQTHYV